MQGEEENSIVVARVQNVFGFVGCLFRRLWPNFIADEIKKQNADGKRRRDDRDLQLAEPAHQPDRSSEPHCGSSRQSFDLPNFIPLQDHTGAEKPDAGDDALSDAAEGVRDRRS